MGHTQWDVEHILLALLQQQGGLTLEILAKLGVDSDLVRGKVKEVLQKAPKLEGPTGQIYITPRVQQLMKQAEAEAERLTDEYIGVEHLLIAVVAERGGDGAQILGDFAVDQEKVYQALQEIRGTQRVLRSESGEQVPSPGEVQHRSDGARRERARWTR